MATSVENWRITIPTLKDNLEARNRFKRRYQPEPTLESDKDCEDAVDTAPCTTCRHVRSQHCGSTDPKLRCKKPVTAIIPSYESLTRSATGSCKYCCCTLGVFFQEIQAKLQGDPNTRICDSLSEIGDIFLAMLTDFVLFLRRLGCESVKAVIDKSHKYAGIAKDKIKDKTVKLIKQKISDVSNQLS
ncbi:uncharacterized protein LOC120635320 isoform X2 [Pararge aegeria]|uniref:uncharacterized protein LOC120635320 isoform X2 n=1 Tax=Pararge aegeria TaxID=116150 RepID=UPI0019D05A5B|nr:uncharacterized protein LOC120635320 isoform X2 [Pararge aegeria]